MTPTLAAILLLAIGLALVLRGRGARGRHGLSPGRTLELDGRTLHSERYGLSGRPDRIFDDDGMAIPEEWKSSYRVHDSHIAQMGVYFILMEEETGVRPLYGVIATGSGRREVVPNTDELRAWVLDVADQIRAAREEIEQMIPVNQPPAKCRACGMRRRCGQAKG